MPLAQRICTACKHPYDARCVNLACPRSRRAPDRRPNERERGYDAKWRRNSARFLKANPTCIDCGAPSQQADHDPYTRAELIARGEPHPEAWRWLKPRCTPCHSRKTATHDGGFGNARRQTPGGQGGGNRERDTA